MEIIEINQPQADAFHRHISKNSNGVFTAFQKDPKTDISPIVDQLDKDEQPLILLYLYNNYVASKPTDRGQITELIELLNTKYKPNNLDDYNYTMKRYMIYKKFKISNISKYIDPVIRFMDIYGKDMRGIAFQGSIEVEKQQLDSLLGSPEELTGTFKISKIKLTTLVDGPKRVHHLECEGNKIKDLEGCPEIKGWGYFKDCKGLVTLKGATVIEEGLDLSNTGFKSKQDIIKDILKYKLTVRNVFSDFGTITSEELETERKQLKMGKFRDLLDI